MIAMKPPAIAAPTPRTEQRIPDDARYADWATGHMRAMAAHASGVQLADENLGRRPARFLADRNLARLDQVRAAHDPHGRFHPYMGRPS